MAGGPLPEHLGLQSRWRGCLDTRSSPVARLTDGIVVTHTAFGTPELLLRHSISGEPPPTRSDTSELYHIWGDDGSGCTGSDQVDDTPNQGGRNLGLRASLM